MMANEHERTGLFTRLDWWDDAACRGGDPAMWVPITLPKGGAQRYGDRTLTLIDQARRTCATCPVLDRCDEWSRDKTDLSLDRGVLAGRTVYERRTAAGVTSTRGPKPIVHGTTAGCRAHYRRGEKPCQPCAEAGAAQNAETRARKAMNGVTA